MNVLILGGNGYLGSKVSRQLVKDGHHVVCTRRSSSDISKLNDIKDKIIWIPASIDGIESAMQYVEFDYVLNMACNYGRSNKLYDDVINANIEFPLKVLNTAVEHGLKKYLTIGTGLPDDFNMYSFSKKMFSEFGRFFVEKHGISFISLQLEMFYGPDEPTNRFIPSVITKMLNGDSVDTTLGTQHRDIISADDILKAIMLVINSDLDGFYEIPIGTGEAPAISEVIDFIWESTGKKSKLNKGAVPMRENEPDCLANTQIIKSIGNWNPVPWKQGILSMIKTMEGKNNEITY